MISFTALLCTLAVASALIVAPALADPADRAAAPPPVAADGPQPGTPAYSASHAGATPMGNDAVFKAFHGQEGIARIVEAMVTLNVNDPRISDIFKNQDLPHLKQMLREQFCYILDGPCQYSGKDMHSSHKDMGLQMSDFNALVENLQTAMDREHVPFRAQNKLLAKLAPMERTTVVR